MKKTTSYYSFVLAALMLTPWTTTSPKTKDIKTDSNFYSQTSCEYTGLPFYSYRLIYSKDLKSRFFVRRGIIGRFQDGVDVWDDKGKYKGRFVLPVDLASGVSAHYRTEYVTRPDLSNGRLQTNLETVPKIELCDGWLTNVLKHEELLNQGIVIEKGK